MRKYLYFRDTKTDDVCLYSLEGGAHTSVNVEKENITVSIKTVPGAGLTATIDWPEGLEDEKEQLFEKNLDKDLANTLVEYVGKGIFHYLTVDNPLMPVFDAEKQQNHWEKVITDYLKNLSAND